ncbi:MAG TPA: hypothetical protein VLA66_14225, partial [Thermoanaerobaculia bacterium]|nr:hypothetical protein [Thermoanaerobaculia bacterium]
AWANRRPERVRIEWRSVRSPWPGWVEVEGLRVAGRTPRMLWEITADHASGAVVLPRLIRRELAWTGIRADGVELRVARFAPPPGARPPDPADVPVVTGFPPGPAEPPGRRPAWSFAFEGVELAGVREIWLDDRRYRGLGRGRGGFRIVRRTTAEVLDSEIVFEGVGLSAGGREVASGVGGDARFRVRPYPYRGVRLAEVARNFDGRVTLAGTIEADEILGYLFGGWERLELESAPSRIEADLRLDHETLRPETRVRISSPRHAVRFLGFETVGDARLDARALGDFAGVRLVSTLELGDWEMGRRGEPPLLRGRGLRLEATTRSPRVDEPPRATGLELDLGAATAPDLGFLNDIIPPAAGIWIERGSASLTGSLRLEAGDKGQRSELRVLGENLGLRVAGRPMSADLEARLRLSQPDLTEAAFSLDGSRLFLRNFSTEHPGSDRVAGWWGEVGVARGRIRFERPPSLAATFDARLRDTQPLVAFYEMRRDLPRWAERLLTLEAVSISGALSWRPGSLRVEDGLMPLSQGEVRGQVEL